MIRILVDMNLSPRWVSKLQAANIHAKHWSELGKADATDFEILSFSIAHHYVILTADLDFSTILARSSNSQPSVIQLRFDQLDPDAAGPSVLNALKQFNDELQRGALVTIDINRNRIRLLPLIRP